MSFLSIDVGSSRCKAAIFSESGEMVAVCSATYAPHLPKPGFAELEPDTFLKVVTTLARELAQVPAREPVQAVCLSSHGETLIPVSATGQALCAAILNADSRATEESSWCESEIGRKRLFSLTGHTSHPAYPLPKLLWLRKHAPEVFRAAGHFLGVTDYLLLRLGLPPLIDYSHAARFMAFDVHRCAWSDDILDMAQIPASVLPAPVPAGTVAGRLDSSAAASLGVAAGTPVVVGGHDQVIGAVGLGVTAAGRAAGSLGTYECILVASDHLQLSEAAMQSGLCSYPHAVPGKFVTIAYFPSGMMLHWLSNLLDGNQNGQDGGFFARMESEAPMDPTGLLVTPHLIGTCNPEFDSHATGAISGLTLNTTRAHLYKGTLEGIASELALITECLEHAGATFADINVSGGGTRSPLGMRLRAALANRSLHVMNCQESVCLGGAMLASVAVGTHNNLEAAAAAMVRESRIIPADPLLAREYAPQLARYRKLRSTLVHRHHQETQQSGEKK